jgi:hypothetical protein
MVEGLDASTWWLAAFLAGIVVWGYSINTWISLWLRLRFFHGDHLVMTLEYTEGPIALENFKRLVAAILHAPAKKKQRQTKKSASVRKPQKSDRD